MRDPHVVKLQYRLDSAEGVTFRDPPAVEWSLPAFDCKLTDDVLICRTTDHFVSATAARAVVEPFLRSWELHVALQHGRREMSFIFEDAEIVDRDPPTGSPKHVQAKIVEEIGFGDDFILAEFSRREYHLPPDRFRVSPDVETMWHRYQGYREGREPLQGMAYFCLTALTGLAGGGKGARKKAADLVRVDEAVLRTLGHLTSARGDKNIWTEGRRDRNAADAERARLDRSDCPGSHPSSR